MEVKCPTGEMSIVEEENVLRILPKRPVNKSAEYVVGNSVQAHLERDTERSSLLVRSGTRRPFRDAADVQHPRLSGRDVCRSAGHPHQQQRRTGSSHNHQPVYVGRRETWVG